ncbi:DUF2971 domain-containing protein [Sphingomonas sp. R647]|uniref:DUF2971 domain-containing protein n=1 Tax=Sphingomonas sp. R647 TaxID=2875233 RepID=UPI001CD67854|nr:DUF2971 domain-containing protein [Sphingomonas sp. R647]MCA1198014.1 DUF2971 domain-containing protein [Sphingomonas sp. R647]
MTNEEIAALFFEDMQQAHQRLLAGGRVVHYTSAEAAARIISGREVWLRNALLMNDFSEIQHGLECLYAGWRSEGGERFKAWLDRALPDLRFELERSFDADTEGLRVATFMMSLSEHDDSEDEFGRLSMWRAYGGRCGVALVLNPTIFTAETDELKVYSAPVRYLGVPEFASWFSDWTAKLIANEARLCAAPPDTLLFLLKYAFRVFALCTKHPGFSEEREWRIFHSPILDGTSSWLRKDNEIINGVPQEVVKIALEDNAEKGVHGIDPKALVNRLIIGPTAHPLPVYHSLHNLLVGAGIDDPQRRLFVSNIPLRD